MLEIKGISKSFGRRKVLDGLDMTVDSGQIVALMGPNGAGKTTLLRIVSTLTSPSSGDVLIDGESVFQDSVYARGSIGVVGHSTYIYDDLTPLENLKFYLSMNGIVGKGAEDLARSLLDRVGLTHRINDRSAVLSRGMRQRLAIARALSHSPKILLLDEPFSSLDQRGVEILTEMLENEREKGRSIIVITHEFSRITSLMDRADILIRGKIHRSFGSEELSNMDLRSSYREIVLEAGGQ